MPKYGCIYHHLGVQLLLNCFVSTLSTGSLLSRISTLIPRKASVIDAASVLDKLQLCEAAKVPKILSVLGGDVKLHNMTQTESVGLGASAALVYITE